MKTNEGNWVAQLQKQVRLLWCETKWKVSVWKKNKNFFSCLFNTRSWRNEPISSIIFLDFSILTVFTLSVFYFEYARTICASSNQLQKHFPTEVQHIFIKINTHVTRADCFWLCPQVELDDLLVDIKMKLIFIHQKPNICHWFIYSIRLSSNKKKGGSMREEYLLTKKKKKTLVQKSFLIQISAMKNHSFLVPSILSMK